MKAIYIPSAILITILSASLWSGSYIQKYTSEWIDTLEGSYHHAQSEDWAKAEEMLEHVLMNWEEESKLLHILLEHQDLDDAKRLFSSALAACKEHERTEYLLMLRQLITQIRLLGEAHTASLQNLF